MSKEIDGTEYACLTINAFLEEENKELKQRIAELEEQLKNAIVLPCIKKHTTYLDIDSCITHIDWYVIYKEKGYEDEIFTIKCRTKEEAEQRLKEIKDE